MPMQFVIRRAHPPGDETRVYLTVYGHLSLDLHNGSLATYGAPCFTDDINAAARYSTARAANAVTAKRNAIAETAGKLRIEKFDPDTDTVAWRRRERGRFDSGVYTALDWTEKRWFMKSKYTDLHFPHISTEDGTKIAFTQSEDHGRQDRQTRMSPAKYLTRYFSDVLDADTIRDLAARLCAKHEREGKLLLAETADEIERVYVNGPSSCMSHLASDYSSPIHPVRVYAGPDLAVAYMERQERITARAVVWPKRKIHSRLYGDEVRLGKLLEEAGYRAGSLEGARLSLHRCNGSYVCPYIDNESYVHPSPCGKYLVIGEGKGELDCSQSEGLAGDDDRPTCPCCDGRYADGDGYYITDRDENWCPECHDRHAQYCERCDNAYSDSVSFSSRVHGNDICPSCAENMICCNCCHDLADDDEVKEHIDGRTICDECAEEYETTPCGKLYAPSKGNKCDCGECAEARAEADAAD